MTMLKKLDSIKILLILGIVVVINLISIRIFTRFDLTSTQAYTLSNASKNLVRSLDDRFLVKAYFTSELPAPYNNNRRFLQDQLDDFRAYGKGNFEYEFIDPSKAPEIEEEARRYGIPPVQVQVIKDDKLQIEKAYMGMVFLYGDKQERLPVVQTLDKLEYDIASNIKKLTSQQLNKIGFLTGHNEPEFNNLEEFRQVLSDQYEVTQVSLADGKPIQQDIVALLIISPKKRFQDWEKYLIDQYIMRGGRVGFFIDRIEATLQMQLTQENNIGLDDWLEAYGARVNADLVRDMRCASITVSQQQGFFVFQNQVPFPYLPIASEFNPDNVLVKNLQPVMFYFASSIDTVPAQKAGMKADVLLTSSKQSGRADGGRVLVNPTQQFTRDMFNEQHIPLAVTLQGPLKSFYAERPVTLDSTVASVIDTAQKIRETSSAKLVVVGDGSFVQKEIMGTRDNLAFAAALVDWLADDIGLTTIRSRSVAAKPLDEVTEGTKAFVKSIILAVPPLLVVVTGVIRWRLRAAWRKRIQMSA
jgi:gliding-associated putative ABC transporter substrate-binding component GldG